MGAVFWIGLIIVFVLMLVMFGTPLWWVPIIPGIGLVVLCFIMDAVTE